eukprot:g6431.t1
MEYPSWSKSVSEVLKHVDVDIVRGLSNQEVLMRRSKHGPNELAKESGTPLWKLILSQFDDMLVKVLLLAAAVSFILAYFEDASGEEGMRAYIEPFVILLILVINAVVGVWQESNAEAALQALKEIQSKHCKVRRDGKKIPDLPSTDLVFGDVVELTAGDRVPADLRIIQINTATLRVEQSSLTGESDNVLKSIDAIPDENCDLIAKDCMLFSGTAVTTGSCIAVVTCTGMKTEIGKIQTQIQQAAEEEEDTPLKQKINRFGELLAQVIFYICVTVWLINYHHFLSWERQKDSWMPEWSSIRFSVSRCTYYFKIAVALAVAAIPEGLPAVITTCLALGTRRMSKKNALIRKLPSVETLGCTTVICSDKTGTLTTNQMSCAQLVTMSFLPDELKSYTVEGRTFNPSDGRIKDYQGLNKCLESVAEICALCNDSHLDFKNGMYRPVGTPTEIALKVLVEKIGAGEANPPMTNLQHPYEPISSYYASKFEKLAILEFDRERKSMSVLAKLSDEDANGADRRVLFVKGAAELLIDRCSRVMLEDGSIIPIDTTLRQQLIKTAEDMGNETLRCLALAKKIIYSGALKTYDGTVEHPGYHLVADEGGYKDIESDMVFVGMVGLKDPPRSEVKEAIVHCRQAGMRVIVITGDNKSTAEAICKEIGIFQHHPSTEHSFTGRELFEKAIEDQQRILSQSEGVVISRAEPRHKQDVIRALKELGEVVAMTGDGVNDAPALKLADIGVAMGITGTEVAKEASDMVLADDNFATIVNAVGEGRSIYNNMKAFIRYMISSNIGEVASIFFTAVLGLPEGLIPVQLLWVNLVTDGPPATALGFNPPDVDIMQKPPRKKDEDLVTPWIFFRWMVIGFYVGFATVAVFATWYLCDSFFFIDLSLDHHTTVTWYQLTHWEDCKNWSNFTVAPFQSGNDWVKFDDNPCDYFTEGKVKASTLSLSVLVAIEMFNALNALSEDNSLIQMPPWTNLWLLLAMSLSFAAHFMILYVPFLAKVFDIVPLSFNEWLLVLVYSLPVILIDEILKIIGRYVMSRAEKRKSKLE